jgi:hypothetical protein
MSTMNQSIPTPTPVPAYDNCKPPLNELTLSQLFDERDMLKTKMSELKKELDNMSNVINSKISKLAPIEFSPADCAPDSSSGSQFNWQFIYDMNAGINAHTNHLQRRNEEPLNSSNEILSLLFDICTIINCGQHQSVSDNEVTTGGCSASSDAEPVQVLNELDSNLIKNEVKIIRNFAVKFLTGQAGGLPGLGERIWKTADRIQNFKRTISKFALRIN